MECWNAGLGGLRSIFIGMILIRNLNQAIIRFSYPLIHFSNIPSFHWEFKNKHNPYGVKSKPGRQGHDSLYRLVRNHKRHTIAAESEIIQQKDSGLDGNRVGNRLDLYLVVDFLKAQGRR